MNTPSATNAFEVLSRFVDAQCQLRGGSYLLSECNSRAKLRSVKVLNVPEGSILIPLDEARKRRPAAVSTHARGSRSGSRISAKAHRVLGILNEDPDCMGHCLADYLLVVQRTSSEYDCHIIELKSSDSGGAEAQLKGGAVAAYSLGAFLSIVHGVKFEIDKVKYVVVKHGQDTKKRKFSADSIPGKSAGDPLYVYTYDRSSIKFARLCGKQE